MRALVTRDLFSMSRIIAKANIKEELRRIVEQSDSNESRLNLGIDLVLSIITQVSSKAVEKEIYVFVADVLECTVQDIEEGDPEVIINRLTTDDGSKQWKDFFSKVAKLIRRT